MDTGTVLYCVQHVHPALGAAEQGGALCLCLGAACWCVLCCQGTRLVRVGAWGGGEGEGMWWGEVDTQCTAQ